MWWSPGVRANLTELASFYGQFKGLAFPTG
jgi:hypothetical protein